MKGHQKPDIIYQEYLVQTKNYFKGAIYTLDLGNMNICLRN